LQLKLPLWASNFVCDWTYDFGQHYGAKVKIWCRQGSPNKSKTYKLAQGNKWRPIWLFFCHYQAKPSILALPGAEQKLI
jgi:hypothetical protein